MKQKLMAKCLIYVILGICICFRIGICQVYAGEEEEKRILFISSYSYSWETVPQQIKGIQAVFGDEYVVDYKFMDTKNISSQEGMDLFYESMCLYLSEVKPYDGIIAGDDAAFQFVLDHREELFPGIPIAFEGVNNASLAKKAYLDDHLISGVVESLSYANTIDLALKLIPHATKITAILDDSITAKSEREAFFRMKKEYPQLNFDEINVSNYSKEELGERLKKVGEDTILLYIMCSEDKEGNAYTSKEAVSWVSSHANVPTFSIVSIGMGYGIIGGEIVSQEQMGYIAAEMLMKEFTQPRGALSGVVLSTPREYCFDEAVMDRFHIRKSHLPRGSKIINHRANFVEKYRKILFLCLLVVGILGYIVVRLYLENRKKNRINDDLQKAKANIENKARYDVLTGIRNRAVFYQELQAMIDGGRSFGMILFDIDGFKNINDTLGHNNGDVVLKELARRCSAMENGLFRVYRLAGDEFTAIVEAKDKEVAKDYARKIKFTFKEPFILEGEAYYLSASIGAAMSPEDGANTKDIVEAADSAMYYVKKHGKNNIALYREIPEEERGEREK